MIEVMGNRKGLYVDGQVCLSLFNICFRHSVTYLILRGQSVIIAGGSKGLGRELAVQLVERGEFCFVALLSKAKFDESIVGANVIVLARSLKDLETTKEILLPLRKRPEQWVEIHSVDLTDVQQVRWKRRCPLPRGQRH